MDLLSSRALSPGDSKRDFNPTCYRTDAQYSHMVSTAEEDVPEKGQKFGFDIVMKKKVQTYIEVESSDSPEFGGGKKPFTTRGHPHHSQVFSQRLLVSCPR